MVLMLPKISRWNLSSQKGFTLIELLVVIAIIGILSTVITASLSMAREKSRDAKRISELTQISKTLELYYDSKQSYPSSTPTGYSGADAAIQLVAAVGFLPKTPLPPPGVNTTYIYHGVTKPTSGASSECTGATVCNSFEIGITLERNDNVTLSTDADQSVGTFYGANADCTSSAVGAEKCFDIGL